MTMHQAKEAITLNQGLPGKSTTTENSNASLERVLDDLQASLENLAKSVRLQGQSCQTMGQLNAAAECSSQTADLIDQAVQDLIVRSLLEDSSGHTQSSFSGELDGNVES